ncbi:HNH endonuclease signature motif containing protein [Euzebya sp.]|uniref:HNH endonuclease signature motif containing protein n=1 Tax=Euzebya sp. TaxID=1971409 RepID=UPI003513EB8B
MDVVEVIDPFVEEDLGDEGAYLRCVAADELRRAVDAADEAMRQVVLALQFAMTEQPDPSGAAPEDLAGLAVGMVGQDRRFLRRVVLVLDAMPIVWRALADGRVSWSQAAGVVRAVANLPRADRAVVDRQLSGLIDRADDPDRIVEVARAVAAELDAARQADRDRRQLAANVLVVQPAFEGGGRGYFEYDPVAMETVLSAASAAADAPVGDDDPEPVDADGNVIPKAWRTPTRRGYQLAEGLRRVCASFLAGVTGGPTGTATAKPSCQVIIDGQLLAHQAHRTEVTTAGREAVAAGEVGWPTAVLLWGLAGGRTVLTRLMAEVISCDASLIPVLLDDTDTPVAIGDADAPITTPMRRAVAARDQGCRFPGCRAPQQWTDCHHVVPRARGGGTHVGNLVALCRVHHVAAHERGWQLHLARDGTLTVTHGRYRHTSRPRLRPPPPKPPPAPLIRGRAPAGRPCGLPF